VSMIHKFFAAAGLLLAAFALSVTAQAADKDDILVLTLKNGDVAIKLRPDLAPAHVAQIKKLVRDGAYDHVAFHRVIEGFMAQTGDVQYGNRTRAYNDRYVGMGQSKYPDIPAEFSSTPFGRGTVGMARAQNPDSANSQFFICFEDASFLNGQYTVIGEVVKGMDVVDKIKKGNADENGKVSDPDEIIKATLASTLP